ncbi:uncharacterized protein LOC114767232 [Denticeps clupeoides]|uniref:uncharacterized protein LOC114767232 n=1 Tax=Denticeps clupeoides TaxID=299321 RepID=UPI0010A3B46C|nr:uncharacterized protein LOC114767232 [Denticeps clupeoides]
MSSLSTKAQRRRNAAKDAALRDERGRQGRDTPAILVERFLPDKPWYAAPRDGGTPGKIRETRKRQHRRVSGRSEDVGVDSCEDATPTIFTMSSQELCALLARLPVDWDDTDDDDESTGDVSWAPPIAPVRDRREVRGDPRHFQGGEKRQRRRPSRYEVDTAYDEDDSDWAVGAGMAPPIVPVQDRRESEPKIALQANLNRSQTN